MDSSISALGVWKPRRPSMIASAKPSGTETSSTEFLKELSLDEVFSLGYIQLDSFAKKLAEMKRKKNAAKEPFTKIDFSKVGYITDTAIRILVKVLGKESFITVKLISLEGCSVVTDLGLYWLVQGLEGNNANVKINISGCTKVTDNGLAVLISCPRIYSIESIATSVSIYTGGATTKGCPIFNDKSASKTVVATRKSSYLVIIPIGTKESLGDYLHSSKAVERKALHYHSQVQMEDWKINIVEAERNHVLFQHLLPQNPTHVLIPFDASLDLNKVKVEIEETIAHVLSKEQPNPTHQESMAGQIVHQTDGWLDCSLWSRINFFMDGTLSILSYDVQKVGSVISRQPMSRINNYFEVKVLDGAENRQANVVIGIMHDVLFTQRFPMETKEKVGGVIDGFKMTPGTVFGFGINGRWESEYVPASDAEFYFTQNGEKMENRPMANSIHGLHPIVSIVGLEDGSVQISNKVTPPVALQNKWINQQMYHTPNFQNNVLCDDEGIVSYAPNKKTPSDIGLIQMQESITGRNNVFAIRAIDNGSGSGALSIGFGPEGYPLNAHPGWKSFSLALHGDNGKIYLEKGTGQSPATCPPWKNGDIIKIAITSLQNEETITGGKNVNVEFYVNDVKVGTKACKLSDMNASSRDRFVFMIGFNCKPGVAQILNFRPLFLNPPPKMNMLTMGRSNYMNIYDDGRLVYRKFGNYSHFSIYVSKTSFNKQLTYFEMKVNALDPTKHCGIGLCYRHYPTNQMVGWQPGSVAYHADNGGVYQENFEEIKSLLKEDVSYGVGDVVGCGIDEKKAVFRPDGSLQNQQTLSVYFTKNGKKVHVIEFEYKTDALFPAVNLHYEGSEVQLMNYYPGSEAGQLILQNEKEKTEKPRPATQKLIEGCQFTVIGIGSKESNPISKTAALQKMMANGPQFSTLTVLDKKLNEMNQKPESMDMQGQQANAMLFWQKECLQRFSKEKSRLNFMSVDVSSDGSLKDLQNMIVKTCENDLAIHFNFYELTDTLVKTIDSVTRKVKNEKMYPAHQLRTAIDINVISNGRAYEALIRFLQKKGYLIWLPMKRTVVAIDMGFSESLVRMSETLSQRSSGKMAPCIGSDTKVWMDIADMAPELKQISKSKPELMSHVLLFFGLIEIPCIRRSKNDPVFCYCTRKSLGKLPVTLADFVNEEQNDVIIIRREYEFLHNCPEQILSIIISRGVQFFRPIAVTSTWCIFQMGAVQVAIFINNKQKLIIETRCFMSTSQSQAFNRDTKRNVEEYSWNIFCIFIDIIDLIITRLRLKVTFSQKVPTGLVNTSIGCQHTWGLSDETYRQTRCTLCNLCCDKSRNCRYNGVPSTYQHQCRCGTFVTGCIDCGICQECAETLWTIRSYLRPNMEVACYGNMKSSQLFPLNATTYDEIEITNLGTRSAPVCLRSFTDAASSLTLMFPGPAMEVPGISSLEKALSTANLLPKAAVFEQGDIVTVRLDPIKRDHKVIRKKEETVVQRSDPVYFTTVCNDITVWHDTGILAYTSSYATSPVGQFIAALPLTRECCSFSFEIINPGRSAYIAIGVCPKRYPTRRQPGWNKGSYGYHADDGGFFTGSGTALRHGPKCTKGDIMKCELDFENKMIKFYKNGELVHEIVYLNTSGLFFHAAIGLHSVGEAVKLLEKEPWSVTEIEERQLPNAFDSYKYGNMYISPGHHLSMFKLRTELFAWLMLHNPSKNVIGYKVFLPLGKNSNASILKPGETFVNRLTMNSTSAQKFSHLDIHWFLLDSSRDYSNVDIDTIYQGTTQESLLKHRLIVRIKDSNQAEDCEKLRLATLEPDENDGYFAEIFKNGVSFEKYWLREGSYVCSVPLDCNVLVRYPKFPTLNHPDSLQKGMRLIVDLSATEKDTFAEGLIQDVSPNGMLTVEYSPPGKIVNSKLELPLNSPLINLKEIHYEKVQKGVPSKDKKNTDDGAEVELDLIETMEAVLNILSYEPRGNTSAMKHAYKFAPFHLLTKASQDALRSLDSSWESTTLQSVACCKNTPTKVTVQELQIAKVAGDDLDWLVGSNNMLKNCEAAFAFLPSQLNFNNVCFPTIPAMFNNVDVHRLCLQTDQMMYNLNLAKDYDIIPDMPLHFINVQPITPSPSLSADIKYGSAFNGWVYSTLYLNKLLLPLCDNMFQDGVRPDLDRQDLEYLMKALIHIYTSQYHLLAEQHGGIAFQVTPDEATDVISASIEHNNHLVVRTPEKREIASDFLFKPFKHKQTVMCKAHLYCIDGAYVHQDDEQSLRIDLIDPYEETITFIQRKMPALMSLPSSIFSFFPNLQYLKLSDCVSLHTIPNGIANCVRLEFITLENGSVVEFPEDFFKMPSLLQVRCDSLLIQSLPQKISASCPVRVLKLSSMMLREVPPELSHLSSLELLDLDGNPLEDLPMELASLVNLKTLHLSGIKWLTQGSSKTELTFSQYEEFLAENSSVKSFLRKEKALDLFKEYDKNHNSHLDVDEIAALNSFFFWNIPRIGVNDLNDTEYGGIPPVIFLLTSLENLYLDYQAITAVPDHINRLQNLRMLSVSHNPLLERLSGALGHSPSLKLVRVISNPSLQTPPHEVYSRGFIAIKAYLKRLAEGLSECRRTKLMFVGLGGAGKTSLLKSLMSVNKKIDEKTKEEVTDGIMIAPWTVKTKDDIEITYSTWDFAGQTLYYNTHQFFLSKRAVYLLLWSARQGFEHSGIEFWLSSIASHTTEAPVFVVATHCDEVPQAPIPEEELRKRYPQIAGFYFVSSKTGANIYQLEKDMLKVTLEQKNMGEQVPQVWLNLEKKILGARHMDDILEWDVIKQFAIEVGLYDDKDVREAINFLCELGTVQYFDTDFLRDKVVINPQWIVNVMACVVSVKDSPIQDQCGKFLHKDIPKIWSTYDPKLHTWLLQLTEEFDLTFPLPKEEVNIVPCILPQEQPKELHWPTPNFKKNMKETKIVYKFEFLPAGLFNRAQVRLFQLSDGKLMWKKGSLLKKNKHLALVEQVTDKELVVKVQGPRPENVIFLIHEIFESLVDESFRGVKYDFMVPCPDCIEKECTFEPCLFEGYLIRKASEFRAPFLQCRKYFHTVSMTQLLEIMPSNSTTDFDAHLQSSLQLLQELNEANSKDVAILFCPKDASSSDLIKPGTIKKDLEAVGYSCWLSDDCQEQELMVAIKNCRILVVLCSNNFEQNQKLRDILLYSMDSLKKSYVIVAVGSNYDWMNTSLGMRIGKQELMVMIKDKASYDSKKEQLKNLVEIKLSGLKKTLRKYCSVFLSYCWENSKIAKNGENKEQAVGWGDPRTIKQQLEEHGISCWLDVENIAYCSGENKGLFHTIAEGMNRSKVILVCISDEYILSENCMRELRFGVLTLKKPVVFAVVGTGKKWKKSEAELLRGDTISSEMTVNLQTPNKDGIDELSQYIRELLPFDQERLVQKEAIQKDMEFLQAKEKERLDSDVSKHGNNAKQEECELVQRKFMRYIISYISSQDTVLCPRLFVIDFEKPEEDMDVVDGSVRSSLARPGLRPKTASRSSRKIISVVLEDDTELWESESFCIRFLCENEQGWHLCNTSYPIKMSETNKNLIRGCSAYLARMYAILQQSSVSLNCLNGTRGEKFVAWIQEATVGDVNFVEAYITLRSNLVDDDGAQAFLNQLGRFHLPTGKIYWLCKEHSKGPRIIHLSTETVSNKEGMKMLEEEDVKMRENMEQIIKEKRTRKSDSKKIILPSVDSMEAGPAPSDDDLNLTKPHKASSKPEDEQKLPEKSTTKATVDEPVKNVDEVKAAVDKPQNQPSPVAVSAVKTNRPPNRHESTPAATAKSTPQSAKSSDSGSKPGSKTCTMQ